jgi:hypothetical protein
MIAFQRAMTTLLILAAISFSAAAQDRRFRTATPADSDRPSYRGNLAPPAPPQVQPGNDLNWLRIIPDVINAIPQGRPNRDWDYDDDGDYPRQYNTRPQQFYTQPQQSVPQAPKAPQRVAPKNEIKTKIAPAPVVKKAAPVNLVDTSTLSAPASAETNARQQLEAQQAINSLDQATAQMVTAINDPVVQLDWNKVVANGSTSADMEKFLQDHGPAGDNKLPPIAVDGLNIRIKISRVGDAIAIGSMTPQQRQEALNEIQQDIANFQINHPNTNFAGFVGSVISDHITEMQNYNTLGMLVDSIQGGTNPFPLLIQGADQMGMPIAFVSEMTGYPVMSVPPASGSGTAVILLTNPKSNGQAVSYLLGDYKYEMNAGDEQALDRGYEVTFDPGVGSAQKQYALTSGVYEWRRDTTNGWNLFKTKVKVEIDNSRYDGEFRYLIDNEVKSVRPGSVAVHESELPIEIAFDGGKGDETRKKLKSGRYLVGLAPDRGVLDIFESSKVEDAAAKEPEYLPSTLVNGSQATQSQRLSALLSQRAPGGRKGVSPLGSRGGSSASVEDLLKSIKKKGAVPSSTANAAP